jgi:hypothetical protein
MIYGATVGKRSGEQNRADQGMREK